MNCLQVTSFKDFFNQQLKLESQKPIEFEIRQLVQTYESSCFKNVKSSKIIELEDNQYCYSCFNKLVEQKQKILYEHQSKVNKLKEEIQSLLQNREVYLRIEQKKQYLKQLQNLQQELKNKLDSSKNQLNDKLKKNVNNLQTERNKLKQLVFELKENTMINESDLLSKRSQMRRLQADLILNQYHLLEVNYSYPDYQIDGLLKCMTFDFVNAEDENINSSCDKNLSKILFTTYYYNQFTLEHKLIIYYSILNLFRFIEYVIRIKGFDVPFRFELDDHKQPFFKCKSNGKIIQIFSENPMPIDENFIYCWINYFVIYKKLGLNFQKLVINQQSIFPVHQLRDFFLSEKYLPQQLITTDYKPFIKSDQEERSIKSDLLKIKYAPNSFKKLSEEINFLRNNQDLKIINFSEIILDQSQIFSKISDHESDHSDADQQYELIGCE